MHAYAHAPSASPLGCVVGRKKASNFERRQREEAGAVLLATLNYCIKTVGSKLNEGSPAVSRNWFL